MWHMCKNLFAMSKVPFEVWLSKALEERGMSQADLVKRAGISSGSLSNLITGYRKPGAEIASAIAQALKLPETVVFRAAGLMKETQKSDDFTERAGHLIGSYERAETRQKALEYLEFLATQEEKGEYRVTPSSKSAKGAQPK